MPSANMPESVPFRPIRWSAGWEDGALCLVNGTTETFLLVRAKGSGKLRSAALLAGTEGPGAGGLAFRMCEPGWRSAIGPGQGLVLRARSGPCTGQALFSLQDAAGKALASMAYAMVPGPEAGPLGGELTLQSQAPEARGLVLVTGEGLPGNLFLVREAHLDALRQALDEYRRAHPGGPGPAA